MKYLNLFITRRVAVLIQQIELRPLLEVPQSSSLKSRRIWLYGGLRLMLMCLSACLCHSAIGLKKTTASLNKPTPSSLILLLTLSGLLFEQFYDEIQQPRRLTRVFFFRCTYTHFKHAFHQLRHCWRDHTHQIPTCQRHKCTGAAAASLEYLTGGLMEVFMHVSQLAGNNLHVMSGPRRQHTCWAAP